MPIFMTTEQRKWWIFGSVVYSWIRQIFRQKRVSRCHAPSRRKSQFAEDIRIIVRLDVGFELLCHSFQRDRSANLKSGLWYLSSGWVRSNWPRIRLLECDESILHPITVAQFPSGAQLVLLQCLKVTIKVTVAFSVPIKRKAQSVPLRTRTAIVSNSWVEASMSRPVCRTKFARAGTSVSTTTIPNRTQANPSLPSPIKNKTKSCIVRSYMYNYVRMDTYLMKKLNRLVLTLQQVVD